MPFSPQTGTEILIKCARRCCICRRFCGTKMQLHHVVAEADGGEDSTDNCIPLCLDCHEEVGSYNPKHPIGRKFSPDELRGHRDLWFEFVKAHPGRLSISPDSFFLAPRHTEANNAVSGWVEPLYREVTAVTKENKTEQREVFHARVRNKGARTLYVETIGSTVGDKLCPGNFYSWDHQRKEMRNEVAPGDSQIFSFQGVTLEDDDIGKLDGLYLTVGSGETFINKQDSLTRLIADFRDEAARRS